MQKENQIITFQATSDMNEDLKRIAETQERSKGSIVRLALKKYLEEQDGTNN